MVARQPGEISVPLGSAGSLFRGRVRAALRRVIAGALAGLSLTAGAVGAIDQVPPAAYSPVLRAVVDMAASQGSFQGVVAAVRFASGQTWLGAGGYRDIARTTPLDVHDQFRIGSVSKTFTGTVVLQLVDQGLIDLDDTLSHWVPELNVPNSSAITVRMLLNMTSGIPDYLSSRSLHDPALTLLEESSHCGVPDGACLEAAYTPPQLVQAVVETPGQRYFAIGEMNYSNTNFALLGIIAQKASCLGRQGCRRIEELVNEGIVARLGLKRTLFPTARQFTGPFAQSAHAFGPQSGQGAPGMPGYDVTFIDPHVPWASGAMLSNASDELVWIDQLANNSEHLLSARSQAARLVAPSWAALGGAIPARYGLAIIHVPSPGTGSELLGHGGLIGAYSTAAFHSPSLGVSFAVNLTGVPANAAAWFPLYGAEAAYGQAIREAGGFSSMNVLWALERNLRIAMEAQGSCSSIGATTSEPVVSRQMSCTGDSVRTVPLLLARSTLAVEPSERRIDHALITSPRTFTLTPVARPSIAAFGSRMAAIAMTGGSTLTLRPGAILEITGEDAVAIALHGADNRLVVAGEIRSHGAGTVAVRSDASAAGSRVVVAADARVGGDLMIEGDANDLLIDGAVFGKVVLAAGSVTRLRGRGCISAAIVGPGILTADSELGGLSVGLPSPEPDFCLRNASSCRCASAPGR